MGCEASKVLEEGIDETVLSDFCGRKKAVDDIVSLITRKNTKTVCVHGAKGIGKTRVINHVLINDSLKCCKQICHTDCSLYDEDCVENFFIDFLKGFYKALSLKKNLELCGTCELCTQKAGCSKLLKEIALNLKDINVPTLICFDDADLLLNSSFKQHFLDFIKTVSEKRKHIKLLVGSTVRFHLTSKATEMYLVDKMDKDELKELIVQIIKSDEDDEGALDYLSNLRTQDLCLEDLAILCDGIPKCAELLGTILREDDYLIKPIELVQLLLTNFIQTLDPDLFAKDDRPTTIYQEELAKFKEISEAYQEMWFYEIAENMKCSEITPEQGLKAVRDDGSQVAMGTFKMDGLRKMLDNSMLQKRQKTSAALSMQRLYQHLLILVGDKEDDGLNLKTYLGERNVALIKEDAEKIGLYLSGNVDALNIEGALNRRQQRMKRDDSGRSSGDEHEDDSGNDSNDSNEGHDRFDSSSGPYAMSFRQNDIDTHNVNGVINETAQRNQLAQSNGLVNGGQDGNHGHENNSKQAVDTEGEYFAEIENGLQGIHVATGEGPLSNTFPTTMWRNGLQPQPQENSDETKLKRKRTASTSRIYVTPVYRLSSEEYEHSIENNCVSTEEASHAKDDRESPTNDGKETCARYSGSSTGSGELKLDFDIKTSSGDK